MSSPDSCRYGGCTNPPAFSTGYCVDHTYSKRRRSAELSWAPERKRFLRSQLKELNALVRDREATPERIRDAAEAVAQAARRYEEAANA